MHRCRLDSPLKAAVRIFLDSHPYDHELKSNNALIHTTLRPSIALYKSHGILTMCPSGAAFAIPLGPTNPWLIVIAKETLIFRRAGFSPALWLLVPTFLLPTLQHGSPLCLHRRWNTLLPLHLSEEQCNPQFRYYA